MLGSLGLAKPALGVLTTTPGGVTPPDENNSPAPMGRVSYPEAAKKGYDNDK